MEPITCDDSLYRKRVFQSLSFQQPDMCPYYIWIDPEMEQALAAHYGDDRFRETIIHDHVVMAEVRALLHPAGKELCRDDFGVLIKRGNIPQVAQPALQKPDLHGFAFPDLSTDKHIGHLASWAEKYEDRFRIVNLVELFSERTWFLRGFEESMIDYHLHPRFMEELLDRLMELCLDTIEALLERFSDRIDAIGMTDDAGAERAMILGPDLWRRVIKPRLKVIYGRILAAGKACYFHSCGHIRPIIPDLIEIGVNMLQPIQPESMDIFELKREFGKDICLVGGISTQKTLPFGTPDEVREEIDRCLDRMAAGGGYVLAPAKPLLPGVPVENAAALIDRFVNQPTRPR